jgi:hypothetical protein
MLIYYISNTYFTTPYISNDYKTVLQIVKYLVILLAYHEGQFQLIHLNSRLSPDIRTDFGQWTEMSLTRIQGNQRPRRLNDDQCHNVGSPLMNCSVFRRLREEYIFKLSLCSVLQHLLPNLSHLMQMLNYKRNFLKCYKSVVNAQDFESQRSIYLIGR